jgi:hypothetical protein
MSAIFSESLDFWVTQRTSIHDPSSTAAPGRTSALPEVPTTAIVRYGHLPAFPSKMCIDVSVYVIFVYNKYGIVCMCVCILYIYMIVQYSMYMWFCMDVYKQNMNVQCIILDQRLSVERGIPVSGVARLRCELAMLKYRWTLGRALPRFGYPHPTLSGLV